MPKAAPVDDSASLATTERLAAAVADYVYDFPGLVMLDYPWGEPGTDLAHAPYDKPKTWQLEVLRAVSEHRHKNAILRRLGAPPAPFRAAVVSGHGVGKSALVVWLGRCFMLTSPNCRGVYTASTAAQLEQKTWPEFGKWHGMALTKDWFTWTATSYYFALYPEDKRKNYSLNASTVSEERSEAFAGLHNAAGIAVVVIDEASGVTEDVFEIIEGIAFAGTELYVFYFGNGTRRAGPFYDLFTKYSHTLDYVRHIDSREVEGSNLAAIQKVIEKYGEDSDAVRVRVKGMFPEQSISGFIPMENVRAAIERERILNMDDPVILGVDPAAGGDDDAVITARQGRLLLEQVRVPKPTHGRRRSRRIVEEVGRLWVKYDASAVVADGVGIGAAVCDTLVELGYPLTEIHGNAESSNKARYGNIRAELWDTMATWIAEIGCIPDEPELVRDLTNIEMRLPEGSNRGRGQGMYLEGKQDYKERTRLPSPDRGDSLSLTFAVSPPRKSRGAQSGANTMAIAEEPLI